MTLPGLLLIWFSCFLSGCRSETDRLAVYTPANWSSLSESIGFHGDAVYYTVRDTLATVTMETSNAWCPSVLTEDGGDRPEEGDLARLESLEDWLAFLRIANWQTKASPTNASSDAQLVWPGLTLPAVETESDLRFAWSSELGQPAEPSNTPETNHLFIGVNFTECLAAQAEGAAAQSRMPFYACLESFAPADNVSGQPVCVFDSPPEAAGPNGTSAEFSCLPSDQLPGDENITVCVSQASVIRQFNAAEEFCAEHGGWLLARPLNLTMQLAANDSDTPPVGFLHVACRRIDDWTWLDGSPAKAGQLPTDVYGKTPTVPENHDRSIGLFALAKLHKSAGTSTGIAFEWFVTANASTPVNPACIAKNFTYENCTDELINPDAWRTYQPTLSGPVRIACPPGQYLAGSNYTQAGYNATCRLNGSLITRPQGAVCVRLPVCTRHHHESGWSSVGLAVSVQPPESPIPGSLARPGKEYPTESVLTGVCFNGACLSWGAEGDGVKGTTEKRNLATCAANSSAALGGQWNWIEPGMQNATCFAPSCSGSVIQSLVDYLTGSRQAVSTANYAYTNSSYDLAFLQRITQKPNMLNFTGINFPAGGYIKFTCKPPYFQNSTAGQDTIACTCRGWKITAWNFSCNEHCPTTHKGLDENTCHANQHYTSDNETQKHYQPVGSCGITCHRNWMLNRNLAPRNLDQQVLNNYNESKSLTLHCLENRTLTGIPNGFNPQAVCERKPCTNISLTVPQGSQIYNRNYSEIYNHNEEVFFQCDSSYNCSESVYIIMKCNGGPSNWKYVSIRQSCDAPNVCQLKDKHSYDSSIVQTKPPVCIGCDDYTFNASLNSIIPLGATIEYKCVYDPYQNRSGLMLCQCDGLHNLTSLDFDCVPRKSFRQDICVR